MWCSPCLILLIIALVLSSLYNADLSLDNADQSLPLSLHSSISSSLPSSLPYLPYLPSSLKNALSTPPPPATTPFLATRRNIISKTIILVGRLSDKVASGLRRLIPHRSKRPSVLGAHNSARSQLTASPSQLSSIKYLDLSPPHLAVLLNFSQTLYLPPATPDPSTVPIGGPDSPNAAPLALDLPYLESFLFCMDYPPDLTTSGFPSRSCSPTCSASASIENSLHWRANYQPWKATAKLRKEAVGGWIYTRGSNKAGQPVVWYRPGLFKPDDTETYIRQIMYNLERASGEALQQQPFDGRVQHKYFFVLDASNFGFSYIPSMATIKKTVAMIGDNFPRRMGGLLITNLNKPSLVFWNLVKPLVPAVVKEKVTIASGKEESTNVLLQHIDAGNIPMRDGGRDAFVYDVDAYFGPRDEDLTEAESVSYRVVMPHYAR